jgi:UDP-sulfoquinovose synthase
MARIVVFGGDGFCGWPTSLYLSKRGHEVTIVDNLSRRAIDNELGISSLTPIELIEQRMIAWRSISGQRLTFYNFTLGRDYADLVRLFQEYQPDAVVHFAEQRAAPYSMKSSWHKRYTVSNNLNATHDLLCAIVEAGTDTHLVHLGTMGVYGYGAQGGHVPEGYIRVKAVSCDKTLDPSSTEILHPTYPGSVYHLTKSQDELFFYFYNKNDSVRVTDLHQGIVWGTQTDETELDARLINRFDYDGDFGTVINRFLVQAAVGQELSVYGVGGQTRGFVNIRDTCRCVALAIENPPERGDRVRIMNVAAEARKIRDLAELVVGMGARGINFVANPRKEAAENELRITNRNLKTLGWDPILLSEAELKSTLELAKRYAYRCVSDRIPSDVTWASSD